MNIENNLILINGEDKTDKIVSFKFENDRYTVIYKNDNEIHRYYFTSVRWLKHSVSLDISKTLLPNNVCLSEISKILEFGECKKIFFNTGHTKLYDERNLSIEEKIFKVKKDSDSFEYLKELSSTVGIRNDENISLLSIQYDRIKEINPKSILSMYLNPKPLNKSNLDEKMRPIFPFGFNLSQKEATEKALGDRISIIEGPPGTGKTQTILNIIANAVINGKTVAVVSNSNPAAFNIAEKLDKYGLSFITAFLGSNANKGTFFDNQSGLYPDMKEWMMSLDDIHDMKMKLISLGEKLDGDLEVKNASAKMESEINEYLTEKVHFDNYYNEKYKDIVPYNLKRKLTTDNLMDMIVNYKNIIENSKFITFIYKLWWFIRYGIYNLKFYNNSDDSIVAQLEKKYYEQKIDELKLKKLKLYPEHKEYNFKSDMNEYTDSSMKLFKSYLYKKYNKSAREIFNKNDLKYNSKTFTEEYPVVLSSTHSLKSSLNEKYLYDYVIIDESSQVDLVTGALNLECAKSVVIVGDLKQLPNIVPEDIKIITDEIYYKYNLKEAYNYLENSILASVSKLFNSVPKTLLKEHYRCHPLIIGYCNKMFYDNKLIVLSENKEVEPLMVYKTAKGNHQRGMSNQRQIDLILKEILPDKNICTDLDSIGIISPYREQAEQLQKVINNVNIEADTVHKFQGREKDIIIISTVSNQINKFIDNPKLINVAVSRAVNKLILVVTDNDENIKNTNIGNLIKYIEYNNGITIESKVYSVFDLLYTCYSNKLTKFRKKSKKVSKYDSENIMNDLIEKTFSNNGFTNLGKVINQSLQKLIKDTTKLTPEEYKFAMNNSTHTDFLIYNKINNEPILVIEVDGYAYHANNKKQLQRDNMKDNILKKYDIPILRLKTNGSGEKEKLYNKLIEVLGR